MSSFIIKVKVQGTLDYITVSEEDLMNHQSFLCRVAEHFQIDDGDDIDALVLDNHGAGIPNEKLKAVVSQFKNCAAFFVEVELLNRPNTSSAQKLRNFLNSSEYDSISTEYKSCGFLTKRNRKKLVNGMYAYILQEVSPSPSESELVAVCNDMLTIFPKLKITNSVVGGMDLYYNPDTKKGFLANKFKNQSRQLNDSTEVQEPFDDDLSEEKKEEYVLFFRTCVASKQSQEIKTKLREVARHKQSMMKLFEKDFRIICKCFVAMPELILYAFGVFFETIDQRSLEEQWPDIAKKMHVLFRIDIPADVVPAANVDWLNFVRMLKQFSISRTAIKTTTASILTFSKSPTDDPMTLMNKNKNADLNVIVVWSVENEKCKYYIDVKKMLISVPESYTFIQVIDLAFKASKVFNIGFHKYVAPLFRVFEEYVYGMENGPMLTPKHLEDANLLFEKS